MPNRFVTFLSVRAPNKWSMVFVVETTCCAQGISSADPASMLVDKLGAFLHQ